MALNGKALQAMMVGQMSSKGIRGSKMADFAGALSEGLVEAFMMQNQVTTIDVGLLPAGGPGTGNGKMVGLNPQAMAGMMMPMVAAERIMGSKSKDLIDAVCVAVCNHFLAANLANTIHPLVAIGSGVGKVLGLQPNAVTAMVVGKMASKGINGSAMKGLVKGISSGFASSIMATAIVNVVIVGSPLLILGVPVPSGGPGNGKIN